MILGCVSSKYLVEFEQFFGSIWQLAEDERRVEVDLFTQRADHLLAVVAVGEDARRRYEPVHCVADGPHQNSATVGKRMNRKSIAAPPCQLQ